EGRADARAEQRRRVDGHGRPDGRRRAPAAEAHGRRQGDRVSHAGLGGHRRGRHRYRVAHRMDSPSVEERPMSATVFATGRLWVRGFVFPALVPLVVAAWVPAAVDPLRRLAGGLWSGGWPLIVAGAAIYGVCLLRFLMAGGTPAIFFTRALRALIGE